MSDCVCEGGVWVFSFLPSFLCSPAVLSKNKIPALRMWGKKNSDILGTNGPTWGHVGAMLAPFWGYVGLFRGVRWRGARWPKTSETYAIWMQFVGHLGATLGRFGGYVGLFCGVMWCAVSLCVAISALLS